jgi:SAM-dependent methyltransferase
MTNRKNLCFILSLCVCAGCRCPLSVDQNRAEAVNQAQTDAQSMIRASQTGLAPVYVPLAEYLAKHLNLERHTGVGIDLGSGPGTLIVELCQRSSLHWINADINPYFFSYFYELASSRGYEGRISAIQADVHALPFRGNYADVIISRGSYHFWKDRKQAFGEILRVLKPGAVAYVGRGFSENLPVDTARMIRARQGKSMTYPLDKKIDELRAIMEQLHITDYRIHTPRSELHHTVNYGLWLEFRK